MKTTVYSADLKTYKLFRPQRLQTDVLILHGSFDIAADSEEIAADRQYVRTLRINADDIEQTIDGFPASILTIEGAKKIQEFIAAAVRDEHDLVVHCHAGQSRTGAVIEVAYFGLELPCVHVLKWQSGRKIAEKSEVVTKENFYNLYTPNPLWHRLFSQLYPVLNHEQG